MKTILLLGGYGFLGTNIIKHIDTLLNDKYQVIVLDKNPIHPYGVTFHSVIKTYAGDYSDPNLLKEIFSQDKIDLVLHSVSTTIPIGQQNARYDIETNLFPTLNILDLMVENHIKNIVYISSGGAIYGTSGDFKHKEDEDVFPVSSYGVIKLTIEKYLMQYAQLYGIKPLILRLSNPYGAFHYSMRQGVINVAIAKALRGELMEIWGSGNDKKDYIYVDDFVNLLFILLEKGISNEIVNIASGQLLSVNDITSAIKNIEPSLSTKHIKADLHDTLHFTLDTLKLHQLIGDYQFQTFHEGLLKTYQWMKTAV